MEKLGVETIIDFLGKKNLGIQSMRQFIISQNFEAHICSNFTKEQISKHEHMNV